MSHPGARDKPPSEPAPFLLYMALREGWSPSEPVEPSPDRDGIAHHLRSTEPRPGTYAIHHITLFLMFTLSGREKHFHRINEGTEMWVSSTSFKVTPLIIKEQLLTMCQTLRRCFTCQPKTMRNIGLFSKDEGPGSERERNKLPASTMCRKC